MLTNGITPLSFTNHLWNLTIPKQTLTPETKYYFLLEISKGDRKASKEVYIDVFAGVLPFPQIRILNEIPGKLGWVNPNEEIYFDAVVWYQTPDDLLYSWEPQNFA